MDFLGAQAPYDALDAEDLNRLARDIEVEYFAAGTTIVAAGGEALSHLWVVRTGAVDITDRGRVVDQLGPGDTFGHISVLSSLSPALSAQAAEDTLCLRIPDPRGILIHPERLRFSHFGTLISRERLTHPSLLARSLRPVRESMRTVVWCDADEPIHDVARLIGEHAQSCALVRGRAGLGIVTDRDFRERVATGIVATGAPIADLAAFPAITVDQDVSESAAFLRMIELGVHHLVVTGPMYQPVGIIRVIDFAAAEVRNPLMIRSAVESAATIEDLVEASLLLPATLVELHDNDVPAPHIGNLQTAVIEAILRKLLTLRGDERENPERSWIILGSLARREPLPRSDTDTAVIWRDSHPPAHPENVGEHVRTAAESLLLDLERCGLRRCADGANATNALFSRPAGEWTAAADRWLTDPSTDGALLLASITVDSRPITSLALGKTLTDTMRRARTHEDFLRAFLRESLALKPPTGFVRDFVVDHAGRHRGQIDLKRGGLVPIAALGRWIAIATGDSRGSTLDRLRRGAEHKILSVDETDTLVAAFEQIYELLLSRDIDAIRASTPASTFITPKELNPLLRRHLRESFRAVGTVQSRLETTGYTHPTR